MFLSIAAESQLEFVFLKCIPIQLPRRRASPTTTTAKPLRDRTQSLLGSEATSDSFWLDRKIQVLCQTCRALPIRVSSAVSPSGRLLCRQGLLGHRWFPNCYFVGGVSSTAVAPCPECLSSSCPRLTASPTISSFRISTNPALSPAQVFSSYLEPKPAAPCVLAHLALGSIHLCG